MVILYYNMLGDECNVMNVMFDTFRNGKREYVVVPLPNGRVFSCEYEQMKVFCHFASCFSYQRNVKYLNILVIGS